MGQTQSMAAWICADEAQTALARAISAESANGMIGSTKVVSVLGTAPPLAERVQIRIVTGCVENGTFPGANVGDLLIYACSGEGDADEEPEARALRGIACRAVDILRGEIGDDASWLRIGLESTADGEDEDDASKADPQRRPKLVYVETRGEMEKFAVSGQRKLMDVFGNGKLPTIVVLSVGEAGPNTLTPAAQDALVLSKEFIQLVGNHCTRTVPSLDKTQQVIPLLPFCQIPELPAHQFPSCGDTILLVVPTENKDKKAVLQQCIAERAPPGTRVHTISVPVESDVNEQPYNAAGPVGAHNRIRNALDRLQRPEFASVFREHEIGTVMVACIENYIQTAYVNRPVDFGIVVVHNAKTRRTTLGGSRGVTVPPQYIARARRFGDDGDENHGNVTVGRVLAAWVPGLDKANWHLQLAGCSRYDLLREVIEQLAIPW